MSIIAGSVSNKSSVFSHYAEVTVLDNSIVNNQTQVRVDSVLKTTNTAYMFDTVGTRNCYIMVDSKKVLDQNIRIDCNPWASNPYVVVSWTGWITHESDGKKTIDVQTYIDGSANSYGPNNCIASGSVPLPDIPRTSSVVATDANIGSASSIIINRNDTSFVHSLWYRFSGQSLWNLIVEGTALTTYGWVVPTQAYALIPTEKQISCEILCRTFSGSTAIGDSVATMTATAAESNCRPDISAVAADVNEKTLALTGNPSFIVKGQSNIRTVISASPKNSADIKSLSVRFGDGKSAAGEDTTVEGVESNQIIADVVDSREYSASYPIPGLTLIPYIPLSIAVQVPRDDPVSGNATLTAKGNYFNGSFGSRSNSLHASFLIKPKGGAYGDIIPLTPAVSENSYTIECSLSNLDYRTEYVIEFSISDQLISKTFEIPILKGEPLFDWGEEDFRFNIPVLMSGNPVSGLPVPTMDSDAVPKSYVDKISMDFIEAQGSIDGWIYRKWNSGIAECWQMHTFTPSTTGMQNLSIEYPFTFNSSMYPIVNATLGQNGPIADDVMACNSAGNLPNYLTTCNLCVKGITTTAWFISVGIQVVGRWK